MGHLHLYTNVTWSKWSWEWLILAAVSDTLLKHITTNVDGSLFDALAYFSARLEPEDPVISDIPALQGLLGTGQTN